MANNVHNTSKFAFSFAGISARGFAEGDAVTVTFTDDTSSSYTGTKGEGGLVVGKSGAAEIIVRLQGTSESIASFIAENQGAIESGVGGMPFLHKARSGDVVYTTAGTALLKKNPDISSSQDMLEVELEFISANASQSVS